MKGIMKLAELAFAKKSYPTGNPKFSVMQAFPGGISDSDPFLMCDHFGPTLSSGIEENPDKFPVGWHPHRGMDIVTYLLEGNGRHADSLGNRETFASPGMQWISVGSGIEHAEGGGTPKGEKEQGFQIWVNVPAAHKMDPPRYGTEPPEKLPLVDLGSGVAARILAGCLGSSCGPFATVQDVSIIDFSLAPNSEFTHTLPELHDNCIVYIREGSGRLVDIDVSLHHCARFDTRTGSAFHARAGADGLSFIVFSGRRLNEPVIWRGPFVLSTTEQLQQTIHDYQSGRFPPVRTTWDYTRISESPATSGDTSTQG